jgi:Zn-dependent oligopeptidase
MPDTNPLLHHWDLPPWSAIRAEHLVPAIESIIADNHQTIAEITASQSEFPTWDDLVLAIVETDARLDEAMGIIETLMTVKHDNKAWDTASRRCGDALAQYKTQKMSNRELWKACLRLAQSSIAQNFDDSRKAVMSKILREFRLSGIDLPTEQQQQLTRLNLDISLFEDLFLSNLHSASSAWSKHIDDITRLNGLPQALDAFALERGLSEVHAWDHDFLAEQLRQQSLAGALNDLRAYFPLDGTLHRLCLFSERMFGIKIAEQTTFSRWHDSVRLFEVSEHGQVIGHIYLDPFHREEASDYAWTATRRNRRVNAEGRLILPIAILHPNFTPGIADHPCLLTHQDLRVLFHEFGHCLQHTLTRSPHHNLSGISQLGRDTAEFAGQLFERWCLSREFLLWLAAHYQTGERLSEERIDKALAAVQTQTSRETARLLLGALLDFDLHHCQGDSRSLQQVFEDVQRRIPGLQLPSYCRFANSFDYMVTGYAATVYAYQWSGVLATEVFKRFQQEWLFNPQTGRAFREAFFSPGDSRSLLIALNEFLGRSATDQLLTA